MKGFVAATAGVLAFVPREALAWGALGHSTVGYVAMQFISSSTLTQVQSILGTTYDKTLGGNAASWADSVRSETAYKFSAPFHYIDAEDSPPTSCSVNLSRDCGSSGCVVTAIQNYTQRLLDTDLSATQRQEALLFVDHFIGDIGQPLHDENYEVGGNDISAICNGKTTNLHAAWDTGMLTTSADDRFDGDAETYATYLAGEINSGSYESLASGWVSCITESALSGTSCPLVWATEANAYNCIDVFDFETGDDLCTGSYYEAAIPTIDLQLAKQGYRLAKWLDEVFA
ncbi:unnamed protein product [Peniophora sp. CBMAI 1063]|nr:unnamed protein product [Peniophora sp. CBMAI 1063]